MNDKKPKKIKKAPTSTFKNNKKKLLNQEMVESGLSKKEFFKEHFSTKKGHSEKERLKKSISFSKPKITSTRFSKGAIVEAHIKHIFNDEELGFHISCQAQGKEIVLEGRKSDRFAELSVGQYVAVKLIARHQKIWMGHFIRVLPKGSVHDDALLIGMYSRDEKAVVPIHRKRDFVPVPCDKSLKDCTVVVFKDVDGAAVVQEELGLLSSPSSYSKVAAFHNNVWKPITKEEDDACASLDLPPLVDGQGKKLREDLRHVPLITIDGADARDFDDAVFAEPDLDARNPGGYRIVVAIADVAYYVRDGSFLDRAAKHRGNSVYFPDYVLPMLPERLSNDLCSLRPNVDRACVVADMVISSNGKLKHAHFKRALMRSHARLTYEDVEKSLQKKRGGGPTQEVYASTIKPLFEAYHVLRKARNERGSLNIESIEHMISFGEDKAITSIKARPHLKAHELIEEMMILANVAVAKALKNRDYPCMYRIHPAPDAAKVENLQVFTRALGLPKIPSQNPTPKHFNAALKAVENSPYQGLINDLVLRCQSQAQYNPQNQGHYGLGLADYCHFTSPIRRYSDLVVHRLLIQLFDLGEGGCIPDHIENVAEHISTTERQAAAAEREAKERFLASYLHDRIGETFDAVIVGVNQAGLFIELSDVYAEAFIPKRLLLAHEHRSSSYFDRDLHALRVGSTTYQLGMSLSVVIIEADPIKCDIIADVVKSPQESKSSKQKKTPPKQKQQKKKE